jgi:hypothetical protein
MKALSVPIHVVVAAIVIIVVALVLLAIFGKGIVFPASLADARNICVNIGTSSCRISDTLPDTWSSQTWNVEGEYKTCKTITGCNSCEECGYI